MKHEPAGDNNPDFIEKTHFYMKMLTGAFSLLSTADPDDISKNDLYDFCFGMTQINEDFTEKLIRFMKERCGAVDS